MARAMILVPDVGKIASGSIICDKATCRNLDTALLVNFVSATSREEFHDASERTCDLIRLAFELIRSFRAVSIAAKLIFESQAKPSRDMSHFLYRDRDHHRLPLAFQRADLN